METSENELTRAEVSQKAMKAYKNLREEHPFWERTVLIEQVDGSVGLFRDAFLLQALPWLVVLGKHGTRRIIHTDDVDQYKQFKPINEGVESLVDHAS